jgi:hypothetical protein
VSETLPSAPTPCCSICPAGPFLRVTAFNTQVTIGGNLFKGDFLFDQTTKSDGTKTTRVAIANGEVSIAGNGIKNAEGAFLATPGGVAGIISGEIAISAGGLSVGGRAGFRVNTIAGRRWTKRSSLTAAR